MPCIFQYFSLSVLPSLIKQYSYVDLSIFNSYTDWLRYESSLSGRVFYHDSVSELILRKSPISKRES